MKQLNVVLIGLGYWGKRHYDFYSNSDKYNLVGVCDINFSFRLYNDIKIINNYKDINLDNIDLISIITPENTHYEIVEYFISINKVSIFIEKPLVVNYNEYNKLKKIYNNFKYKLLVGNLYIFDKLLPYLKDDLGSTYKIEINWNNFFIGYRNNLILDIGIHIFSILGELFGKDIENIKILNIIENRYSEIYLEFELENIYIKINISNNSLEKRREIIVYKNNELINKYDFLNLEICKYKISDNLLEFIDKNSLDKYLNLDLELNYIYDVIKYDYKDYKNNFIKQESIIKLIDKINEKKNNSI